MQGRYQQQMPIFPKSFPKKLAEFLVGMTKTKGYVYGTEYGGSVVVRLLEYYQQLRKILKPVISMNSAVSKDKLIMSRVRNWPQLGAAMCFGTQFIRVVVNSKFSGCNIIDSLTTDNDISNMFSSKIALLFNSDLDQSARNSFLADLTDYISKSDLLNTEISSTVVLNALDQLKNGKSDDSSLFSNAFIFAESILSNPLSYLFTAVVRHGYDPKHLRDCILQLIPKPGKDPNCSDNYRQLQNNCSCSNILRTHL